MQNANVKSLINSAFSQTTTMPRSSSSSQTLLILLLLFVSALVCAYGVEIEEEELVDVGRHQREFDYFSLSLQWAATFCRRTRYCCSSNACCRGSKTPRVFTIHGLWPDYNDGSWPSCCSGHAFDPKEVAPLKDALEQYWPTLSCSSPSNCHGGKGSFWGHEWEKHGTCSYPVFRNEYDYFLATLNIYFKYNVTSVLNEAGYVPSNTEKYPLGGIISAIENAFHLSPSVICSKDAVQEIRLCFYKDFKPRDCVVGSDLKIDMVTSKGSCPKYVSLPEVGSFGRDEFQSWESDEDAAAL